MGHPAFPDATPVPSTRPSTPQTTILLSPEEGEALVAAFWASINPPEIQLCSPTDFFDTQLSSPTGTGSSSPNASAATPRIDGNWPIEGLFTYPPAQILDWSDPLATNQDWLSLLCGTQPYTDLEGLSRIDYPFDSILSMPPKHSLPISLLGDAMTPLNDTSTLAVQRRPATTQADPNTDDPAPDPSPSRSSLGASRKKIGQSSRDVFRHWSSSHDMERTLAPAIHSCQRATPNLECRCSNRMDLAKQKRHWEESCPFNLNRKRYSCEPCGKTFSRPEFLKRHQRPRGNRGKPACHSL